MPSAPPLPTMRTISPGWVELYALGTPIAEILLNGFSRLPSAFGPADLFTKMVLPATSIKLNCGSRTIERSPVSRTPAPLAVAPTPSWELETMAEANALAKSPAVFVFVYGIRIRPAVIDALLSNSKTRTTPFPPVTVTTRPSNAALAPALKLKKRSSGRV